MSEYRDGTAVSSEDSDGEQGRASPAPASSPLPAASEASCDSMVSSPRTLVYETRDDQDEDDVRSATLSPTEFDDDTAHSVSSSIESSSQSTEVTVIDVARQQQMDAEQPRETDDSGSDGPPSRHRSPSRVPSEVGEFAPDRGAAINEDGPEDEAGAESGGVGAEEVSLPRETKASAAKMPARKESALALVLERVAQFVPCLIGNIIGLVLCAMSFMWKASMAAPDPAERASKGHKAPKRTLESGTERDTAEQSDQGHTGLDHSLTHSNDHRSTPSARAKEAGRTQLFSATTTTAAAASSSFTCGAPTKGGAPCKRSVKEQGQRCYQHSA